MKARIVEVYTPDGAFLLSQQDGRVICQGHGINGVREFGAISQLPTEAKMPVFYASCKLSHEPHRFISRDPSTNGGSLSYDIRR
ncbi:hypothetical protein K2Q00_00255 [Patescibacteria group bacterium]|nr:hypothetical protein [Patescibacteria group bacterium]